MSRGDRGNSIIDARGATKTMWAGIRAIFKSSVSRDSRDGSFDGINPLTVVFGVVAAAGAAVATPFTFAYDKITGADKGYWFEQGDAAKNIDSNAPPVKVESQARGHGHERTQERSQDAPITDKGADFTDQTIDMMEKAQARAIALGGDKLGLMVSREFNKHEPATLNAMAEKAADPRLGKGSRDRFLTSLLQRKTEFSPEDIRDIETMKPKLAKDQEMATSFKDKIMKFVKGRGMQSAVTKTQNLAGQAAGYAASAEKLREQTQGSKKANTR